MRLRDLLHKPAELWRMGLELCQRKLGYGSKSRRLADQQATINQLRFQLHEADKELDGVRLQRDSLIQKASPEDLVSARIMAVESSVSSLKCVISNSAESYSKQVSKLEDAIDRDRKTFGDTLNAQNDLILEAIDRLNKPAVIGDRDKLISKLREESASAIVRCNAAEKELENERLEHAKQKNATAQMWKFIHERNRLDVNPEKGSIREALQKAEIR